MSAYAQHRLVINVKRRHLTLLVSVQACNSSATQRERDTYAHVFEVRAVKACLRVAPPSAHSTGIFTIHPFGIHSILAAVAFDCGSLKPHGKRQVNASFLILLPQHLYVSACRPRTLIFI